MCKLLGISFKDKVQHFPTKFYLSAFFKEFGDGNPHGWGFGFYNDTDRAVLFKEAIPARQSQMLRYLLEQQRVPSKYVIAHVRLRSVGPIIHQLAQPFTEDNILFVHNGTLSRIPERLAYDMSDSLHMFNKMKYTRKTPAEIYKFLTEMNKYGSMSVIVSTPNFMLAYRDSGNWPALHYRKMKSGIIVSSMPFGTKKDWKDIAPGAGVVFVDGKLTETFKPAIQPRNLSFTGVRQPFNGARWQGSVYKS